MAWSTKAAQILVSHSQACIKTGKSDSLLSKINAFGCKTMYPHNGSPTVCRRSLSSQAIVTSMHLSRKSNITPLVQPRSLSLHLPLQRSQNYLFTTTKTNLKDRDDVKHISDKKCEEFTLNTDNNLVGEKYEKNFDDMNKSSQVDNHSNNVSTARKTSSCETMNSGIELLNMNAHTHFKSNPVFNVGNSLHTQYTSDRFKTADMITSGENEDNETPKNIYHIKPIMNYFLNYTKKNFNENKEMAQNKLVSINLATADFTKELKTDNKVLAITDLNDFHSKIKNDSSENHVKCKNVVSKAVENCLSKQEEKLQMNKALSNENKSNAESPKLQTYNSDNIVVNKFSNSEVRDKSYDRIIHHKGIMNSTHEQDQRVKSGDTKHVKRNRSEKDSSVTSSNYTTDKLLMNVITNKEKFLKPENKLYQQLPFLSTTPETQTQALSYNCIKKDAQNKNIGLKTKRNDDSIINAMTDESSSQKYSYKSNSLLESKIVNSQIRNPKFQKTEQKLLYVKENHKRDDYNKNSSSVNTSSVSHKNTTHPERTEMDGHTSYIAKTKIPSVNRKVESKNLLSFTHVYTDVNSKTQTAENIPVIYHERNTNVSSQIRDTGSEQIKLKEKQSDVEQITKYDKTQGKGNRKYSSEHKNVPKISYLSSKTTMSNDNNYSTDKKMRTSNTCQRTDSVSENTDVSDPISEPFIQTQYKMSNKVFNKNQKIGKEIKVSEENVNPHKIFEKYEPSDIYSSNKTAPNNRESMTTFANKNIINYKENNSGDSNILREVIPEKGKMMKSPGSTELKQNMNTTSSVTTSTSNSKLFQASSMINVKQDVMTSPEEADKKNTSKKLQKISVKNFANLPTSNDMEYDKETQNNSLKSALSTNEIIDSSLSKHKTSLSQEKDHTSSDSSRTLNIAKAMLKTSLDHENTTTPATAKPNFELIEINRSPVNIQTSQGESLNTEKNEEDNIQQIKSIPKSEQIFSNQDRNRSQQNFNIESINETAMKNSDNLKSPEVQESDYLRGKKDDLQFAETTSIINETFKSQNVASDENISPNADKQNKITDSKKKESKYLAPLHYIKNLSVPASFEQQFVPRMLDPYHGTNIKKILLRKHFTTSEGKNCSITNKLFIQQSNSSANPSNMQLQMDKSTKIDVAKIASTISNTQRIPLQFSNDEANDEANEEIAKITHYFSNEPLKEKFAKLHKISKKRSNIFHTQYKDAQSEKMLENNGYDMITLKSDSGHEKKISRSNFLHELSHIVSGSFDKRNNVKNHLASLQESEHNRNMNRNRNNVSSAHPLLFKTKNIIDDRSWSQLPLHLDHKEIISKDYKKEKSQKLRTMFQTMADTSQTSKKLNVLDMSFLKEFPDIGKTKMRKLLKITTNKLIFKHGETNDYQATNVSDSEQRNQLKKNNGKTHWEMMSAKEKENVISKTENNYVKKAYGKHVNQLINMYGEQPKFKEMINSTLFLIKSRTRPSQIRITDLQSPIQKYVMQEQSMKDSAASKFKILHSATDGEKVKNIFKTVSAQIPNVKKTTNYVNVNRHVSAEDKNKKIISRLIKNLTVTSDSELQGKVEEELKNVTYIPDVVSQKYNSREKAGGPIKQPSTFKLKSYAEVKLPISKVFLKSPVVRKTGTNSGFSSVNAKRTYIMQNDIPDVPPQQTNTEIESTSTNTSQQTSQNSILNILQIMWNKVRGK